MRDCVAWFVTTEFLFVHEFDYKTSEELKHLPKGSVFLCSTSLSCRIVLGCTMAVKVYVHGMDANKQSLALRIRCSLLLTAQLLYTQNASVATEMW